MNDYKLLKYASVWSALGTAGRATLGFIQRHPKLTTAVALTAPNLIPGVRNNVVRPAIRYISAPYIEGINDTVQDNLNKTVKGVVKNIDVVSDKLK